jgi:dihydrofolate reductase
MAKLIYLMLMSLDGYIADEDGKFDWAEPDEQVHTFVNDLARPVGTYLYGRRMYEVMTAWENPDALPGNARVRLELLSERRFGNGMVFLRYRTRT